MTPVETVLWLTLNCMKEGPFEPPRAQQAIAHVVLNRAAKAKTNVAVEILRRKQFSWTLTSKPRWVLDLKNPAMFVAYTQCSQSSDKAVNEKDFTNGAEYYHRHDVHPSWEKEKIRINDRYGGEHIFYKDDNSTCDFCKKPTVYNVNNYRVIVQGKVVELKPDFVKKKPLVIKTKDDGIKFLILMIGLMQ